MQKWGHKGNYQHKNCAMSMWDSDADMFHDVVHLHWAQKKLGTCNFCFLERAQILISKTRLHLLGFICIHVSIVLSISDSINHRGEISHTHATMML